MIDSNFLTWVRVRFSNVGFIDNLEHAYIANEDIFLALVNEKKIEIWTSKLECCLNNILI